MASGELSTFFSTIRKVKVCFGEALAARRGDGGSNSLPLDVSRCVEERRAGRGSKIEAQRLSVQRKRDEDSLEDLRGSGKCCLESRSENGLRNSKRADESNIES